MKYFYIGLLILCMLLCACYFSTREIDARVTAVIEPLRNARHEADRGHIQSRQAWIRTAQSAWQKGLPLMTCLLSHSVTEEISDKLEELPCLPQDSFSLGCDHLIHKLLFVQQMDRLRLGNVL